MKKIKILGTGCPKCAKLAENADTAARESGITYEIEKISDIDEILKFRIMMTPALVIDGEVLISGRIPGTDEIKKLLVQ